MRQKPLQDLQNAWVDGCLTRAEYAHALQQLQHEERQSQVRVCMQHANTRAHQRACALVAVVALGRPDSLTHLRLPTHAYRQETLRQQRPRHRSRRVRGGMTLCLSVT